MVLLSMKYQIIYDNGINEDTREDKDSLIGILPISTKASLAFYSIYRTDSTMIFFVFYLG